MNLFGTGMEDHHNVADRLHKGFELTASGGVEIWPRRMPLSSAQFWFQ